MQSKNVVAVDMGSSSIRATLGQWDGRNLRAAEVLRKTHTAKLKDGILQWDLEALCRAAKIALRNAHERLGAAPDGIAINGWGVDYVLVNPLGQPVSTARCYRDAAGKRGRELMKTRLDEHLAFKLTGIFPQDINTCYQLSDTKSEVCSQGRESQLMFLPDFVARTLLDQSVGAWASRNIASTSGMLEVTKKSWQNQVVQAIGRPDVNLPELRDEASVIGSNGSTAVILGGSHDTACAVNALPPSTEQYISCGSWSVVGVLTPSAVTTESAYEMGVTNEAATDGRNRLQFNITGLWILQECLREWRKQGKKFRYADLVQKAQQSKDLPGVLDVNDNVFSTNGSMPQKIAKKAADCLGITLNQPGEIALLVMKSMAEANAEAVRHLRNVSGVEATVHVMGGGARNRLLMQLTANALQEPIALISAEATSIGNMATQLKTLGVESEAIKSYLESPRLVKTVYPK